MNDVDTVSPDSWKHNHNGPGHVFTATVSLLQESQMPHSLSHPFSVSQSEIDRLLHASTQLNLESEMTPIQLWQEIKDLSNMYPITPQLFVALTKDLSKYTFCNRLVDILATRDCADKCVPKVLELSSTNLSSTQYSAIISPQCRCNQLIHTVNSLHDGIFVLSMPVLLYFMVLFGEVILARPLLNAIEPCYRHTQFD